MKRLYYMMALCAMIITAAVSCSNESDERFTEAGDNEGMLHIELEETAMQTRADAVTISPSTIRSITLAAYDEDGIIADSRYFSSTSGMYLKLDKTKAHTVLVFANMGDLCKELPSGLAQAMAMKKKLNWGDINSAGFPMTGTAQCSAGLTKKTITVKRLLAKVTLNIDTHWPENMSFTLKKVTIGNTNGSVGLFSSSKASSQSDLISGDFTGSLASSMVFYLPENLQGDLLKGNADPYHKTRESLVSSGKSSVADLCSYIDVLMVQENTYGVSGEIRFRFYIGTDNTSNFDVDRNSNYTITLRITADGTRLIDNWKVDNSGISDSRTLSFSNHIYDMIAGGNAFVRVNYSSGGTVDNEYSAYRSNSGWDFVELPSSIRQGSYIPGKGVSLTGMAGVLKVGDQIPIRIETFDGVHYDEAILRVIPSNVNYKWEQDFIPSYIAQSSNISADIPEGFEAIRFRVPDDSADILEINSEEGTSANISCIGAGKGKIEIIGLIGDDEMKLGEAELDVQAPVLHASKQSVSLSIDGTTSAISVYYTDKNGNKMTRSTANGPGHFNLALYQRLLKPVVKISSSDAGRFINATTGSIYVNNITSGGKEISDYFGDSHSGKVTYSPTDDKVALSIAPVSVICTIMDPFPGADANRLFGYINNKYDGGYGTVASTAVDVGKAGSKAEFDIKVTEIVDRNIVISSDMPDIECGITSGKVTVTRKDASDFSAGRYVVRGSVLNTRSNEYSSPRVLGYVESYLMSGICAVANERFPEYEVSVAYFNRFSETHITSLTNYMKSSRIFGFNQGVSTKIQANYYVFDYAEDSNGEYISPDSNDFYTWGTWCDVYAYDDSRLVGPGTKIYTHHIGRSDLDSWDDNMKKFYTEYTPMICVKPSVAGTINGVSKKTSSDFILFYLNSDTIKGETGIPYHLLGIPVAENKLAPIEWKLN